MSKNKLSQQSPSPQLTELPQLTWHNPFGGKVYWVETCTSTMDLSLEMYHQNKMGQGDLLLTGYQSKGRGRHASRAWICQPGQGFLSTLILRKDQICQPLALRVGLALCRSIEEVIGLPTQIKWPNDVLIFNKKAAGVLIEQYSDLVLIGLGINLYGAPEDHGTSIKDSQAIYGLLHQEEMPPIPTVEHLAGVYLDRLFQSLADPAWRTSVKLRLAYRDSLVSLGRTREDWDPEGIQGFLRDLDPDGGLVLELGSGSLLKVNTGTLRPVINL